MPYQLSHSFTCWEVLEFLCTALKWTLVPAGWWWCSAAEEVAAVLTENNGSLLLSLWLQVWLTAQSLIPETGISCGPCDRFKYWVTSMATWCWMCICQKCICTCTASAFNWFQREERAAFLSVYRLWWDFMFTNTERFTCSFQRRNCSQGHVSFCNDCNWTCKYMYLPNHLLTLHLLIHWNVCIVIIICYNIVLMCKSDHHMQAVRQL